MPANALKLFSDTFGSYGADGLIDPDNIDNAIEDGHITDRNSISYPSYLKEVTDTEGVANEGATLVKNENNKLDTAQLKPVFEGAFDQAAWAALIVEIMDEREWSLREAMDRTGIQKSVIQRLRAGTASYESYEHAFEMFGYSLRTSILEH